MKKILVIPLWFGDMFDKTTPGDINRVCQYLLRSLLFFGTKEGLLIMYPKTDKNICELYISHFKTDGILPTETKTLEMAMYTESENNNISLQTSSAVSIREELIKQLKVLKESKESPEDNVIVFINTVHIPLFVIAIKSIFGLAPKMSFDFQCAGGVGNTEAFFFNREDRHSAEYLPSLSYLDFFIPKNKRYFSPEIMKLGNRVHKMIKKQGHIEFLSNLAKILD